MILVKVTNTTSVLLKVNFYITFVLLTLVLLCQKSYANEVVYMELNESKLIELDFLPRNVVLGSSNIADVSIEDESSLYILAKKVGKTNVIVKGDDRQVNIVILVSDRQEQADSMNDYIKSIGFDDVEAVKVNQRIFLNGSVADLKGKNKLNRLVKRAVGSSFTDNTVVMNNRQVKIELTLAEVSKDLDEQLGVEWGAYSWAKIDGAVESSFSSMLTALSKDSLANILTKPSLVVSNDSTAQFQAGGEVPVLQYDDDEVNVSFKQYGIELEFKPEINSDESIDLRIMVKSSQISGYIDMAGIENPTLNSRMINTKLNVSDGDTFALAGLIDNSQTQAASKVPYLGRIPILGALFTSEQFKSNKTELMVFAKIKLIENKISEPTLPSVNFKSPMNVFFNLDDDNDPEVQDLINKASYKYED